MSVCRTITVPVEPVWPIVLQDKFFYTLLCSDLLLRKFFHISVKENSELCFVIFQTPGRLNYLYYVGMIFFKRTLGFVQFSNNQVLFYVSTLRSHPVIH